MTKVLRAKDGSQVVRVEITAGQDEISGGVIFVDNAHHEVHEGAMYVCHFMVEDVANDEGIQILLILNGYDAHTVWAAQAGGDALVHLYENPTVSANGASLTPFNVNRNYPNNSGVAAYSGPTVSDNGIELLSQFLPGGSGGNADGGAIRTGTEFILNGANSYLFSMVNVAGTAQTLNLIVPFYID